MNPHDCFDYKRTFSHHVSLWPLLSAWRRLPFSPSLHFFLLPFHPDRSKPMAPPSTVGGLLQVSSHWEVFPASVTSCWFCRDQLVSFCDCKKSAWRRLCEWSSSSEAFGGGGGDKQQTACPSCVSVQSPQDPMWRPIHSIELLASKKSPPFWNVFRVTSAL